MNKSKLIIAVTSIICMSALGVSIVYAWFLNAKTNKATLNNVKVGSGVNLEISIDGINFNHELDLDFDGLSMVDVTGDGVTFYRPKLELETDVTEHGITYSDISTAVPDTSVATWATPAYANNVATNYNGAQYISMTIYFRAETDLNVYLGGGSYIYPAVGSNASDVVGSTVTRKSDYGNFSLDGIAGAARLSVIDTTDSNPDNHKLKVYWNPNYLYELSYNKDNTPKWSLNLSGTQDPSNCFYVHNGTTYELKNVELANIASAAIDAKIYSGTLPNVTTGSSNIPTDAVVLTTLTDPDEDGRYTGSVKINIWIEGCDRESRKALAGGIISALIKFVGKQ